MTLPPDTPVELAADDSRPTDVRCARASAHDEEELAGTAPTDTDWLFVEYAGPWAAKAVAGSRWPEQVRAHLAGRPERVQLIRRHGRDERQADAPIRVFATRLGDDVEHRPRVAAGVLAEPRDLIGLDTATLAAYEEPLWFVCTNGSRDVCCAEQGRPVTAALAQQWPEATWETTHLGGHRFAATLMALPSGLILGRLDADSAVRACEEIGSGAVPGLLTRGHAGRPGVVQYAEMHLRTEFGYRAARATGTAATATGVSVTVRADDDEWEVSVEVGTGEPRQASCADLKLKAAPTHRVVSARILGV